MVRAIGRKLIDARIDQLQNTLTISRTTQRTFRTQDWGRLASQLGTWRVSPCRLWSSVTAVYCSHSLVSLIPTKCWGYQLQLQVVWR